MSITLLLVYLIVYICLSIHFIVFQNSFEPFIEVFILSISFQLFQNLAGTYFTRILVKVSHTQPLNTRYSSVEEVWWGKWEKHKLLIVHKTKTPVTPVCHTSLSHLSHPLQHLTTANAPGWVGRKGKILGLPNRFRCFTVVCSTTVPLHNSSSKIISLIFLISFFGYFTFLEFKC